MKRAHEEKEELFIAQPPLRLLAAFPLLLFKYKKTSTTTTTHAAA
jgi:hypothetical protein